MASEVSLSLQLWPLPGKIGKRHKTPMSKHVSTPPSLTASEKCCFSIYWVPTAAASCARLPLSHQAPTERSHRIRLRTASSSSKRSKKPYKNVIQASAAFNCMKQKENRRFDDFLRDLRRQAGKCGFGGKTERLVGDHFIVGIRDEALRK